ncbi:probable G-protein coupled receptor No9 [Stylophora pistillata]|uniref:probable G-protein coupled receptor No9 n=1 Tax=Stylophora pistillata TaxID=50429 RepID=UPI000C054CDA|nr:probable G-protein coupled receptor No9 [Stylophora pistillata]
MSTLSLINATSVQNPNDTHKWQRSHYVLLHNIQAPSILLAVVILLGNSLVITSYKINGRLRTRTNAFLVSLAVSDFLVGSISMPMWIYNLIIVDNGSVAFKAVFKTFDVFSALASIYHLTAISIERYIAVSRPFYYKSLPSLFQRAMITSAWLVAILLASFSSFTMPSVLKIPWNSRVYATVMFIIGFAIPAAIIFIMYVGVFSVARSLLQRNPHYPPGSRVSNGSLMSQYYQGERKVAITVAFITGLFIATWVPFFIVSITASYCLHCLPSSPKTFTWLIVIVKGAHYLNSGVNPLVYAQRDSEMRRTFLTLLGFKRVTRHKSAKQERPWGIKQLTGRTIQCYHLGSSNAAQYHVSGTVNEFFTKITEKHVEVTVT